MKRISVILLSLCAASAWADVVHVTYQISAGGTASTVAEATLETGCGYTTIPAPTKSGYIFTHWSSSESDPLVVRDAFGRALDAARFTLYQDVTLTAHYVSAAQDKDGDGIPDGSELYWYGDLAQDAASDTDGDGFTFAEEIANGTNPLMPENDVAGPLAYGDGGLLLYNPSGYASAVVRSEPSELFAASEEWLRPGTYVGTPTCSPASSAFAYWVLNGVPVRDAWGRAVDRVELMMPTTAVELVAHTESDYTTRMKLYWYGRTDIAMDSDTDGDGYTFAEELANGTNPLMPDSAVDGPVAYADGDLLQYNPYNLQPYTIKSDPEGSLFETIHDYAPFGTFVAAATYSPDTSTFACWVLNGVEQRDAWGRAIEVLSLQMSMNAQELVAKVFANEAERLSYYWYGRTDVPMDSDTDGDGYTFAEELANGTNPLMPDSAVEGPVAYADSDTLEANLQPFDPATGAVVGEAFEELFTSPFAENGATSRTFGPNARPIVADVNGDGLFDLVILYDGGYAVYLNGGTSGNPMFTRDDSVSTNGLDLAQGSLAALDGLTLDVPPTDAVSCAFGDVDRDGIVDLLVSDAEGRIWFYRGLGDGAFALQHKVWGGSHAGFAPGLTITLVDWDGDGDLDCVCGTADGKLMLLVDPRVGRPTNVRATAGVDSVVLTWDPNGNSRVRGYGVYRGADTNAYDRIEAQWPLPRYRDVPETVRDYYYRVTSVSRFYTSGNSTPTTSESLPTDAVYVQFRPSVWLNDASGFTGSNVTVIVSMNNSMGLSAEGLSLTFAYDPAVLAPRGIRTTGLTAGLAGGGTASEPSAGTWRFASQGGEIATGAGRFLLLDFAILPVHDVTETTVTLTDATVKALDGRAVALDLPQSAKVEISDSDPLVPALVAVHVADAAVDSETEFELLVTVTATETLTNFTATVTWDETQLDLRGFVGATAVRAPSDGTATIATTGGDFALKFYAKDPASAATNFAARVSLTGIAAVDCHGFVVGAPDAAGTVLIKNAHPWVPARVSVTTEDRKVDTLEEVTVPFRVTSDTALTQGTFTVEWDDAVLELKGLAGASAVRAPSGGTATLTNAGGDFALTFVARDQHDVTMAQVRLVAATVTDAHGFTVAPSVPVVATILVHDAHPLVPANVSVRAGDAHAQTLQSFSVPVTVTSTKTLTRLSVSVGYDASVLEYRGCVGATWNNGTVTAEGMVPQTFTLTFYARDQHSVTETAISLSDGAATCTDGLSAHVTCAGGTVRLTDANPPVAPTFALSALDVRAESGKPFVVNVGAESAGDLAEIALTVAWDAAKMSFDGTSEAATVETPAADRRRLTFAASGTDNRYHLRFTAARIAGLRESAQVRVTAASAIGANGLQGVLKTELPVTSSVLIVREVGRYDPGDIDGDGRYTADDLDLLNKYIAYLNVLATGNKTAIAAMEKYKLTDKALKAADVNCDGKVDANDVALLAQYVAAANEEGK